jgi:quinohemoprotein ethanol dehydrogenase
MTGYRWFMPLAALLFAALSPAQANAHAAKGVDNAAFGNAPDLRASPVLLSAARFAAIVRDGTLVSWGIPRFADLSDAQLDSLRHFVRAEARDSQGPQAP